VLDFGQDPGAPAFISFELLQGRTLNHVLAEGPLTEARAIGLGVQIASSLAEAHLLGIVHRDIKPANIMLLEGFPGDFVKVMDFGIAKVISNEGAQALTATGEMLGTPSYMAPEQIRGDHVGPQTDVYSLALLLVESLTGVRFVGKGGAVEACIAHLSDDAHVLPTAVRRSCIGPVLAHALQKEPAQRLISMAMFHAQLKERLPQASDSVLVAAPEAAPAPDVSTLRLQGAPPKPPNAPPQFVTAPMALAPVAAAAPPRPSSPQFLAALGPQSMAVVAAPPPLVASAPSPGQVRAVAASSRSKKSPPTILLALALVLVTATGAGIGWLAFAR
jgi:serine/threonine-protein kinase